MKIRIDNLVSHEPVHTHHNSLVSRAARRSVIRLLRNIRGGTLTLSDAGSVTRFGEAGRDDAINASMDVCDPRFYRLVLTRGAIGAAEAYFMGYWQTPDLTAVIRLMCRNLAQLESLSGGLSRLNAALMYLRHRLCGNSRAGARRNIQAHYDLGNDFYRLFLDRRMMYSSAIFPDDGADLERAAQYKLEKTAEALDLSNRDHVLEIGGGWGGLAIYLAENTGCRVTTTTISDEQYRYALEQVRQRNLEQRITVLNRDYRELTGRFDKLVSVEMIEAVGAERLPEYFRACDRLLKPGGRFLLQAITLPEQRYERYLRRVDFIQRYIFPGGSLPSLESIQHHVGRATRFRLLHMQDIGQHYARTLACWRERFLGELDSVRALGFDDRFIRLWLFYLGYCEGGFRERAIGTARLLYVRADHG